jgi:hypothetical protein
MLASGDANYDRSTFDHEEGSRGEPPAQLRCSGWKWDSREVVEVIGEHSSFASARAEVLTR